MNLTSQLGVIFHPIGMACAVLTLTTIIVLGLINKQLVNRMTVRLIFAIALADLLKHVGEFYAATHGRIKPGTAWCTGVNGFKIFTRTFYCFTNLAICFHLYRSVVQIKKTNFKYEFISWVFMLILTIIFTVVYYLLGAFSGINNSVGCNPGAENKAMNIVFYLISGLLNLATAVTGIFVTVTGHRSLNEWINAYSATLNEEDCFRDQLLRDRKKMAQRSFLYPLATAITLPVEAIFLILKGFGVFVLNLTIPIVITTGLSGLLTGVAFAVDPASHQAIKSAYYQAKNRKSDKAYNDRTIPLY